MWAAYSPSSRARAACLAAVPGGSFYSPRSLGRTKVRFMWAKRDETLHQAGERLLQLKR